MSDLDLQSAGVAFARFGLLPFAIGMWAGYEPGRHHDLVADKLEAVERGEIKRLMIFMPPGHGKSMLASEFFPAWFLGRDPKRRVIHASYSQELAEDFGRKVRNFMKDQVFRAVFPWAALAEDSKAASKFGTDVGGAYVAAGVGSSITGRRADLFLIDDPIKGREDADSEAFRRRLKDWFREVAFTRLAPGGAIVIIQTRWHEDDLAGWLIREHPGEGFIVVSLPAIAESADILGRNPGEALWPVKFPVEDLLKTKEMTGSRGWNALYQQRPMPLEGGLIKIDWFQRYERIPPEINRVIQSWDTAGKAGELNDYSVCTTWGETTSGWFLIDVFRKRMEYPELKASLIEMAGRRNPTTILVEDKGTGQPLLQEIRASTRLPVIPIVPQRDKVVRMAGVTSLIEAKRVFIPQASPWLTDFESELIAFPNGAFDDQVDSTSQALEYMRDTSRRFEVLTAPVRREKSFFKGY